MKIKKWQIIIGILVLVGIGFFVFGRDKSVKVKEIPLKSKVVKRTVSASGTVTSKNDANLSFAGIGRVSHLAVREGDEVLEGTYLGSLDNIAESQATQSLKDSRDIALRDLDLYIEQYSTNRNAVSGFDEYEIGVRRLQELASKAEANYQAQIATLGKTYLNAPFDGKIIDILYEVGETATSGSTVVKMADVNNLVFEIELDQEDFGFLKVGQKVEITLDAYEGETFEGQVTELPSYVDSADGTDFIVKIDFSGLDSSKVLLGMTGDAFIILSETQTEVPALTFDEIFYDIEDNPYVFILSEDKAVKQSLETGLQGDIYTELKTRIDAPVIQPDDDKVDLEEGTQVKIQE